MRSSPLDWSLSYRWARPRLLVSVAAPEEIPAALEGGADVLDLKDPSLGSLGAPRPELVRLARASAPPEVAVTAAMGDGLPASRGAASDLLELAREIVASGAALLKVGLADCDASTAVRELHGLRRRLASDGHTRVRIVAVAFADGPYGVTPAELPEVTARARLSGSMLDTLEKTKSIFTLLGPAALADWVAEVRRRRLLCGLAGSLGIDDMTRAAALGPHVIGVRGAVCDGGRAGRISAPKVRQARAALHVAA